MLEKNPQTGWFWDSGYHLCAICPYQRSVACNTSISHIFSNKFFLQLWPRFAIIPICKHPLLWSKQRTICSSKYRFRKGRIRHKGHTKAVTKWLQPNNAGGSACKRRNGMCEKAESLLPLQLKKHCADMKNGNGINIIHSARFLKSFKRLGWSLRQKATKRDIIFRKNPFDPRLGAHKLHGQFVGFWAYSVDHHYRVIFTFRTHTLLFTTI